MNADLRKPVGIVGYGAYIPVWRVRVADIAQHWQQDANAMQSSLKVLEKSVPGKDEDTLTIAVQASRNALERGSIDKKKIGAVYVGSESHPYAVKPTATILGQALGIGTDYMAADLEFACKAGSAGLQICYGLVQAGMISYGLAVGSDTAQSSPGDVLEYSACAAGAAFIVGLNPEECVAIIDDTLSCSSDTPDFWRRGMQKYPEHTNRFTGEPSYFKQVIDATIKIMEKTKTRPDDFDYAIFHQPNGKFPLVVGKKLGFTNEQLQPGLVVNAIGNSYSASALIGLAAVLDVAKPNQRILMTCYGSGSGSDAFVLTTMPKLAQKQTMAPTTQFYVERKKYISYAQYLQHMALI